MPGHDLRVDALGVAGAPAPNRLTTTFRLAGGVLVDTGAAAHGVPVAERERIDCILLSHAHLDHTLGLPFLLADVRPRVFGPGRTLDVVQRHLLDGHVWPNLSAHADWHAIEIGDRFEVGPWAVEVGPASHTVPCVSYCFRAGDYSLALVGDTLFDETVAAWVAERRPTHCAVEASYPDGSAALARRCGHQTPRDLRRWRAQLGPDCRLWVTHLKPGHEEAVRAECEALGDPALHLPHDGQVLHA
ncbi:MAG: MBL fold metallo-hydrolase [Planctomycetota bacterium]